MTINLHGRCIGRGSDFLDFPPRSREVRCELAHVWIAPFDSLHHFCYSGSSKWLMWNLMEHSWSGMKSSTHLYSKIASFLAKRMPIKNSYWKIVGWKMKNKYFVNYSSCVLCLFVYLINNHLVWIFWWKI